MNTSLLNEIVNAVLYEGYILYPYRGSSTKNRRERFTFGRVYPEAYSLAEKGAEPSLMQTECLLRKTGDSPRLNVRVRFLQPLAREVGAFAIPLETWRDGLTPEFHIVPELRVGKEVFTSWHEAVEREVSAPALTLDSNSPSGLKLPFRFFGFRDLEPVRDSEKRAVGLILRRQETVEGNLEINAQPLEGGLFKITVGIQNTSTCPRFRWNEREAVTMFMFASTHTILSVENGEFISLMDPPADLKAAVRDCRNLHTWPVLVGDEQRRDCDAMLSSPIILYDYPKIAPESAGSLFDGTEIDEILTLRIQTMTDDEKREARGVDELARRLLERTESLSEDDLLRLHGAMRRPDLATPVEFDDFFGASTPLEGATVDGVYLRAGDRVRIRPKARADVLDLALGGQTAVIEAVEQDMEKRVHFALVLENDPGRDLGLLRQPGHRFFYGVDEVEPLPEGVA